MNAPIHCQGSLSIEDFSDEALITEAIRRGLIARRIEDWEPRARAVLGQLEATTVSALLWPERDLAARTFGSFAC